MSITTVHEKARVAEETHRETEKNQLNQTILQRIAAGDAAAVDDCLNEYGGLVWTLAKRYCRVDADAEDATQEIFLDIWQKADRYDTAKATEATFIAILARRKLIDRFRRTISTVGTVSMESAEVEMPHHTEIDAAELSEEARKAAACMEKLPEEHRRVLAMTIQDGRSQSSIAELLKLPLGTVKSYARRGLLRVRDCMKQKATYSASGGAL